MWAVSLLTAAFVGAGLTFAAQFFTFRVVVANYYWFRMISAVAGLPQKPVRVYHTDLRYHGRTCAESVQ